MTDQKTPEEPRHRGDFAEGEASEHVTTDDLRGDYAEGQEKERRRGTPGQHRGDYGEGQESEHHEGGRMGDFARGQEEADRR
jgi:hypothetical protein